MSKAPDYIPKNNEKFMLFQLNLNTMVTANASTWNLAAASVTELNAWSSGFTPFYNAISNEGNRTAGQMAAYEQYRKNYVAFLRQFCQGFLTNNPIIPLEDRVIMKLNPRGLRPRTKREKIGTSPILSIRPLSGGEVFFGFKVEGSNKITARHPESNGVEVFYKIVSNGSPTPPPPLDQPTPKKETPDSKEVEGLPTAHGYTSIFSSRARFTRQLELDNIGKIMHVYARWVNTSDASLNSTFSMMTTVVIS